MSAKLPAAVQTAIDAFSRLPGIGPKMASRLTFYMLQKSDYDTARFIDAIDGLRHGLQDCQQCGNISEKEFCSVCQDANRSRLSICVVEGPLDVIALEKTGVFHGLYHVLGGALSPLDGIGPDQLRIRQLEARVKKQGETGEKPEIIIATNPSLEGEATATYLTQLLSPYGVTLSRIARGLPMGSDVEYADPTTLQRALEGRKVVE